MRLLPGVASVLRYTKKQRYRVARPALVRHSFKG
jgi:hypothetical protein